VTPLCATGVAPSYNQAVDMIVWDNWALSSHLGNTSTYSNNVWDGTWASNYEFLNGLVYQLEADTVGLHGRLRRACDGVIG